MSHVPHQVSHVKIDEFEELLAMFDIEIWVGKRLLHRRLSGPPAHRLSVSNLEHQVRKILPVSSGTARKHSEARHLNFEGFLPHNTIQIRLDSRLYLSPVHS